MNASFVTQLPSLTPYNLSQFYDDAELDVLVVPDGATEATPRTATQGGPVKRKHSLKRPSVSIKSSGFFSQSVV